MHGSVLLFSYAGMMEKNSNIMIAFLSFASIFYDFCRHLLPLLIFSFYFPDSIIIFCAMPAIHNDWIQHTSGASEILN